MIDFLRQKIAFITFGLVLGISAFGLTIFFEQRTISSAVSLSDKVIEVVGPEVEHRTLSARDLEPGLLAKIKEGIYLLESSSPLSTEQYVNENVCFRHGKAPRALRKEISFAILDTKTREVFEKRCWFSKEDAERQDIIVQSLEKISIIFGLKSRQSEEEIINEELALIVNWWNSHNSDIEVKSLNPQDKDNKYIIIGNKYPMLNSSLAYPQDKTGKKYSDIIYVPYSDALHTPEIIEEGKKFLNQKVDEAFSELRKAKIRSIAYPDKLVVDTITPEFLKNIFLTEQTDPSLVLMAEDGGLRQAERVLVRLGANQDKAYRYTYSSAGALGLGQIMPGTYDGITRAYPGAKLAKDNNIGRVEIVNAIKASILVFDDHFASVLRRLGSSGGMRYLSAKTPEEIEEMKAAIYNGGASKINPNNATISSAVSETVHYVAKFKRIRLLGIFSE